jgi:hypothetical protein
MSPSIISISAVDRFVGNPRPLFVANTSLTPEQTPDAKRLHISTTDLERLQQAKRSTISSDRTWVTQLQHLLQALEDAHPPTTTPIISRLNLTTPPPTPPSLIRER